MGGLRWKNIFQGGKRMRRTTRWQSFSSADPRGGELGGDVAENAGAFRRPCTKSPEVSLSEAGCGRTPISQDKSPAVDLIPANYSWLESRLDGLQDSKVSIPQTPGVAGVGVAVFLNGVFFGVAVFRAG